jgi:O-succinylhomoserine sulfhydrylase
MLQRPLQHGADVVIYSATKHIDGQGRCLGGVILSSAAFIEKHVKDFLRQTGPSLSPFNAWVLLKGLETLPLRVARQTESAAKIADILAERPEVESVVYPGRPDHPQHAIALRQMTGGGSLVAFRLRAGKSTTFSFMNALRIIKISNNLGDSKSLIAHPATTTHQRLSDEARAELGITAGTVRLSAGLEHPGDLIADLDQAFRRAGI